MKQVKNSAQLSEQISTLVPTVAFSDLSSVEGLNHVRDLQIKSTRVKKIIFLLWLEPLNWFPKLQFPLKKKKSAQADKRHFSTHQGFQIFSSQQSGQRGHSGPGSILNGKESFRFPARRQRGTHRDACKENTLSKRCQTNVLLLRIKLLFISPHVRFKRFNYVWPLITVFLRNTLWTQSRHFSQRTACCNRFVAAEFPASFESVTTKFRSDWWLIISSEPTDGSWEGIKQQVS